jgi:nitroreductase
MGGIHLNEVINAIKGRRSIRAYSDKQLSPEETALIVEAGSFAPSAHNEQPWHFTVVQNKELLDDINRKANEIMAGSDNEWLKSMGANPSFRASYDAPTVIFVSGLDGAISAQTDCAAAIQNMMLAAYSLGIGSVWVGLLWPYLHSDEARATLKIPDGYTPQHAIAFGYAAGPKLPAPPRKPDVADYIR